MECKLPSNEDPAGSLVTYEGLLLLLGKHSFTQDELQLQEHSNIIAKRPTLCQVFVDLVLASRHVHEDLERDRLSVTAASNAISVLNYGSRSGIFEFRFIDVRDWSGIRIPGANLNYAVMAHCNLTDANLSGATMIHITLVGAQLTRANLSGIQTGEMMVFHTRSESETTASSPDNLIVHPNGYVAASGDSAGIIRIFNLETDEDIGYLNGHTFAIRSLAFNRDGTYLSSISDDETLRIWDVATYECKSLVQLHASKNLFSDYVAFSPDTTRIVVVWIRERFRVWNIGTSEWGMEFEHECVKDVDWSSDGRHILSFSMQGLLRLWDAESGVRIAEWVENHVYITNAKFTPDSTKIVVNGKKCISILNAMTAKVIATIPQPGSDGSRFAIDDRYVYLSSRLFIHAFDLERGKKCVTKFVDTPKSRTLFSVAEGKRLIVYCDKARTLRVFDTASFGLCVPSTIEGNPRYLSVTFCPNNRHLVAGYFGLDGDLKFLDALTGYCLETVRAQSYQNEISGLQCCPNGRLIAFRAGYMNVIDVYDVNERKCLPSLRHVSGVLCYTFSPKGDILASGLDRRCHCEHNAGNIILWDTTTWTWRVLRGHTERVHDVCFSPDGKMLASGSEDQTIRIWNVATEECVKVLCDDLLYGTVYLSYSPCGRFLASLNAGCLRIWNMTTLTCVTSYTSAADVLIGKFLFLHGGRILVRNPAYQMFDLFTGECVDLGVAPNAKLCMSYDHRLMTTKVSIDAWNAMYVWRFQKESWESRVVLEDPIIAKASASVQLLKVVPEEGGIVVVSTSDQDGSIWIQSSGKDATPTLLHGHSDLITCTQVSSDNLYLVSGSRDGTIRLWNLQTNQCVGTLEGHTGAISCVQFGCTPTIVRIICVRSSGIRCCLHTK